MVKKIRQVSLEQVYKPADPAICGIPINIVDFRVAVHSILGSVEDYAMCIGHPAKPKLTNEEDSDLIDKWFDSVASTDDWVNYCKASWAMRLHRGPDMLPRAAYRVIVVDDNKATLPNNEGATGYWRHIYANDYKGTRAIKRSYAYHSVKDIGQSLCKDFNLPFYTEPLYEADDWAGLIHRIKLNAAPGSLLESRELYYSTVDSDWLQLVDDASRQLWANTGPWPSRLKNEAETRAYILKRMKYRIVSPRDIAKVKQKAGDEADNLAIGADLSLFDLCNPNPVYDLANTPHYAKLVADMNNPDANTSTEILHKAASWLTKKALPIIVKG